MSYNPNNPNGQTTMASSAPVVVASDQSAVPVSGTVTVNAGTNTSTASLALETGGNLASIKSDVDNLALAQASTTSGQKGNLALGAVTTTAPTYTTGQSNPISLTTAGAMRTDASATTQPVSGTVTANAGTNLNTSALALDATLTGGTQRAKITDGTNNAAVKAASTAAVATDPAIVVAVSPNNTVASTQSGTWTVQPGNTANTTPWLVEVTPTASGGETPYSLISAATTNATSVKASAGQLYTIIATNTTSSARYLKLYNKASAPTVGTDTPTLRILIPANGGISYNTGAGLAFSTGIAFAVTGGIADSDTTAVALNDVLLNLGYK